MGHGVLVAARDQKKHRMEVSTDMPENAPKLAFSPKKPASVTQLNLLHQPELSGQRRLHGARSACGGKGPESMFSSRTHLIPKNVNLQSSETPETCHSATAKLSRQLPHS